MNKFTSLFKGRSLRASALLITAVVAIVAIVGFFVQYIYKSRAGVESSTISLNFVPHEPVRVNDDVYLVLTALAPADKKVTGLDLYIKYDESSDLLDFQNAKVYKLSPDLPESPPQDGSDITGEPYFNETPLLQEVQSFENAKLLHLVLFDTSKQSIADYTNSIKVVIHMKAKAPGTTTIKVVPDVSTVAGSQANTNTLQFTLNPTVIGTELTINGGGGDVTPTPPPAGTVPVKILARFQGIIGIPQTTNKLDGEIEFLATGSNVPQKTVISGTFNTSGVWEGTVNVPFVSATQTYKVFMKMNRYLQKRFCDPVPVSTNDKYECTEPKITLVNGNNTLDFTGVLQLVGDVEGPFGVIDSVDVLKIRNNIFTKDAQLLKSYDLNLNGEVEVQDYSLPVKALTIQNTDEE